MKHIKKFFAGMLFTLAVYYCMIVGSIGVFNPYDWPFPLMKQAEVTSLFIGLGKRLNEH